MFLLKTAFLPGVMLSFWYHNSKTHLFVFVHRAPPRVRAKTNKVLLYKLQLTTTQCFFRLLSFTLLPQLF